MPKAPLTLTLTLTLLSLPASAQQRLDTNYFHRITNDLRGPELNLSVINGSRLDLAAVLEPVANVSSQFWRIDIAPGGTVSLSTLFKGPTWCLDIIPEGGRVGEVDLRPCNGGVTQRWQLRPEGTRFQIVSQGRDKEECLEVIPQGDGEGRLRMNICGFYANQLWSFAATDQPVAAPP